MESIKTKQLFEAASTGRIDSLKTLLDEHPLILDRISVSYDISDTPLHVAAMLGHTDFVKEIIRLKPQLVSELNSPHLSSPLHLASARGHVDIARALLAANSQLGLIRDKNGLAPVHLAAIKGRIEVLKVLLRAEPGAARLVVHRGDNILHLCVKYYQLEALKVVVNTIGGPDLLNAKDGDGNTVLHLAVADKQVEVVNFLLTLSEVLEVSAMNLNGMTALDTLIRSKRDVRDSEIEKSLKNTGDFGTTEVEIMPQQNNGDDQVTMFCRPDSQINKNENKFMKNEWVYRQRNSLMVVASLIATMAFQVGVNPPGGVWQDNDPSIESKGNATILGPPYAGRSIFAYNAEEVYLLFYIANTIGFTASLTIILLLMSGLPCGRRFFTWILMVIIWIAIIAAAVVYVIALIVVTPNSISMKDWFLTGIGLYMIVWALLTLVLPLGHTIRLVVKAMKKLMRMLLPKKRKQVSRNTPYV